MEARPAAVPPAVEQSVVNAVIYRDGLRTESPPTVAETARRLRALPGAMAWIGLYRPAEPQLLAVAEEFGLHELAVEDAIVAHQRPKLERYGDTLFVVLRAARYRDEVEEVEFSELHVFVGPNFIVAVRHGEAPNLAHPRERPGQCRESTPISCNSTFAYQADAFFLAEVDSVAEANNVAVRLYVRNDGGRKSQHRLATLGVNYWLD